MNSNTIATVAALRQAFAQFMGTRGYSAKKPDSLISDAFPTTFNVSGGPNFADDYLDRHAEEGENFWVNQHCIRHWDYDAVGDGFHLSFFEMGVTCCFNGFTREKMFRDHLEFLTSIIGLPVEKLWISVFDGGIVRGHKFPPDTEACDLWRKLGIPEERIILIPTKVPESIAKDLVAKRGEDAVEREAFVANAVEPVGGPRTEIFFDTGKEPQCKPTCLPSFCKCGKFIEFWTSVHYTYYVTTISHDRDRMGNVILHFEPIENHRIFAAGFGLERLMQIVNSFDSIYKVDTVSIVFNKLYEIFRDRGISERDLQTKKHSMIVTAEHIRGITFLIAEGVTKLRGSKNRSRKYQYRRYIKNLLMHMHELGIEHDKEVIRALVDEVIRVYRQQYPQIKGCTESVVDEVLNRADSFKTETEEVRDASL